MARTRWGWMLAGVLFGACAEPAPSEAPPPAGPPAPPMDLAPAPTVDVERLLAALPAPYSSADYVNGRREFARCRACHALGEEGGGRVGPPLYGVWGRPAGAVPNFAYSPALAGAQIVWGPKTLDRWLEDPQGYLPGVRMNFLGVDDPGDRRDVIAYIAVESNR